MSPLSPTCEPSTGPLCPLITHTHRTPTVRDFSAAQRASAMWRPQHDSLSRKFKGQRAGLRAFLCFVTNYSIKRLVELINRLIYQTRQTPSWKANCAIAEKRTILKGQAGIVHLNFIASNLSFRQRVLDYPSDIGSVADDTRSLKAERLERS